MIEARIILDSINPAGKRLTTWLLTYPRFIHSEFMTHRVFSRNAASSRAIPFPKMVQAVLTNPALPEFWGSEKPGMAPGAALDDETLAMVRRDWLHAREGAVDVAEGMAGAGLHKSLCNRLLEPFMHMTVLATATDHGNFFKLRAHPAAQPEFQVLAYRMLSAYLASQPQRLEWEEWHLPGLDERAADMFSIDEKLKITVALAARASFSAFADGMEHDKAFALHDKLADAGHWSPFEHAAQAISDSAKGRFNCYPWSNFDWPGHGGPSGWGQYRKLFTSENQVSIPQEVLASILNSRPEWVKV